jgi:hypothetical protein
LHCLLEFFVRLSECFSRLFLSRHRLGRLLRLDAFLGLGGLLLDLSERFTSFFGCLAGSRGCFLGKLLSLGGCFSRRGLRLRVWLAGRSLSRHLCRLLGRFHRIRQRLAGHRPRRFGLRWIAAERFLGGFGGALGRFF